MLNLERSLVNAESQYHRNEIEYRKLEHLQSQLDSFSGLGTLIAGFVFVNVVLFIALVYLVCYLVGIELALAVTHNTT